MRLGALELFWNSGAQGMPHVCCIRAMRCLVLAAVLVPGCGDDGDAPNYLPVEMNECLAADYIVQIQRIERAITRYGLTEDERVRAVTTAAAAIQYDLAYLFNESAQCPPMPLVGDETITGACHYDTCSFSVQSPGLAFPTLEGGATYGELLTLSFLGRRPSPSGTSFPLLTTTTSRTVAPVEGHGTSQAIDQIITRVDFSNIGVNTESRCPLSGSFRAREVYVGTAEANPDPAGTEATTTLEGACPY